MLVTECSTYEVGGGACVVLLVRVQFSLIACGKNLSYACSAYGNSVSSPWFGRLESLMVLCAFLTHHLV